MKDIIYISLSRALIILGQLAYIKIYTSYLSSHELGIYAFWLTVSYSLNALIFVPFDNYQQSRIYEFKKEGISLKAFINFNKSLIKYVLIVVILVIIPYLFFNRRIAVYIFSSAILSIVFYLSTALKGLINNLEHREVVSGILIIETFSKILFIYMAVLFVPMNSLILILSSIVAGLLVLIVLTITARRLNIFHGGTTIDLDLKKIFIFSYPISIGAILNWLQLQGYRLILVPLGYAEVVGIYATMSSIGSAGMNAYSMIFGQMFVPNIYKTHGEYTRVYVRNAFLSVCCILVISYFISDIIVEVITKTDFVKYSKLILYGIITEAGNFIIGALGIYFAIKNKTVLGLWASFFGMGVMIFIFILLYKHINVNTVGLPIILSQILTTLFMFFIYRREIKYGK